MNRPPLRLVEPGPGDDRSELHAALRLLKSNRGAIVTREGPAASIAVDGLGLSPEEEAACRTLAGRAWQQPARGSFLTSALGESMLLARPLAVERGDAALVVAMRSRGGKIDAERMAVLQDVCVLLEATRRAAAEAEATAARLEQERRQTERLRAVNRAFQSLADTEDVESACRDLLGELAPHFPGVDFFAVWLLEADGSRMRRVAARDDGSGPGFEPVLPLGQGRDVDFVVRSGTPKPFDYPRSARSRSGRAARKAGMSTILYVPLRSRNALTGLLTFASREPRPFTRDECDFLETLAPQLGGQLDAIRERERTEAEWERLRTLIDTLPVGIALLDSTGRVVLWNRAVEQIWGHGPLDVPVERISQAYGLLTPEGRTPQDTPIARIVRGGEPEAGREYLIRGQRNGSDRPVLINAAPIHDAQGRLTGVVTVYQDIGRLREVDRLKDDFISTVSHELRTPTTTVRGGALTLLRRGDQLEPGVRRQLLEDMAEEAERLYHLVEDLLVLSRVQAGMQLQTEPMIAHRFVNKVILELGGRVGNHGLTVEVPENLPLVDADPACLEQVLRNLLENAVKFSPRGRRIEITAEPRGEFVMFSVLDRGSGIPTADMDRVFEPFYKTAEAVRTGSQGAGLGLAVCRRLVQVQGGQIWAEARPGGGTAFRFTLPAILDESTE